MRARMGWASAYSSPRTDGAPEVSIPDLAALVALLKEHGACVVELGEQGDPDDLLYITVYDNYLE